MEPIRKGFEEFISQMERSYSGIKITNFKVEYNPTYIEGGNFEMEYHSKDIQIPYSKVERIRSRSHKSKQRTNTKVAGTRKGIKRGNS